MALGLKVYSKYGKSVCKRTVSKIFWHYFCNSYTGKQMYLAHYMEMWKLQERSETSKPGQLNGGLTQKNDLQIVIYYFYKRKPITVTRLSVKLLNCLAPSRHQVVIWSTTFEIESVINLSEYVEGITKAYLL